MRDGFLVDFFIYCGNIKMVHSQFFWRKARKGIHMATQFFRLQDSRHVDGRRSIVDFTFPTGVEIPFIVKQVKIISLSQEAVDNALSIGNHFHTGSSNRIEFFIAVGKEGVPLFRVRTREQGGEVIEQEMRNGDACLILPETTHSFLPLVAGAQLWGISNLAYDSKHDVVDRLF